MKTLSTARFQFCLTFIILCAGVSLSDSAHARRTTRGKTHSVARVVSVRGTASVTSRGSTTRRPLGRGARLTYKDTVRTGPDSSVRMLLNDRSVIDMGASTVVNLARVNVAPKKRRVGFRLSVGRVWARVSDFFGRKSDSEFEVRTNNAVAGVRGTELIVEVDESGKTVVTVVSGAAELASLTGDMREGIGPMMTATLEVTGPIRLTPADAARLRKLAREMTPKPGLGADEIESLRELGLMPGQKGPERLEPARLDIIDTPAPPLDDEPGAFGTVEVRGRAQFED